MSSRPEITWSLLHPRRLDPAYVDAAIAAAADYHVDSFEICGEAHVARGGLDGAVFFRDYPAVAARMDRVAVQENISRLRACIERAHGSGRPVYYWHREVMVPRPVVESVPGLLDENGEFDLLGEAYHRLLRAKLAEFFENVPALDGVVLTLTESDYSVIHNSNPRRYPPAEVVAGVIRTFAQELQCRGKRLVVRSFGSIASDYEAILAGAESVAGSFEFEIETKITPYDFSPFLPLNPYLRRTGRARLAAEYDSIGEFLGAGYLPAPDPARVIECVRYAQLQGVDRHVLRVDRIGHAAFASTQAINLYAFDRAIQDPGATADGIWSEWAVKRWPGCALAMTTAMRTGIETVKQTHFIDGHLIFHAFPIDPTMKWIKAAGILSVFRSGVSLHLHSDMWGIQAGRTAPSGARLLREKIAAVEMADAGLRAVEALRESLPAAECGVAVAAWRNATVVTRLIRAWCRCLRAYGDDMIAGRAEHPSLNAAIGAAQVDFSAVIDIAAVGGAGGERAAAEHEYGGRERGDDGIDQAYARPLWQMIGELVPEFKGEWAERAEWQARSGLIDVIVCGGVVDDSRVRRYMHASHAKLIDGRPARAGGNRVFPNGFVECQLEVPAGNDYTLAIRGDPRASRGFQLTIGGVAREVLYAEDGSYTERRRAPANSTEVTVRIGKAGADYPWIFSLATLVDPAAYPNAR